MLFILAERHHNYSVTGGKYGGNQGCDFLYLSCKEWHESVFCVITGSVYVMFYIEVSYML